MYSTDVTRDNNGRSTTTTVYLGNVEHVIADNGSSTYKRHLANGTVLVTRITRKGSDLPN